MVFVEHIRSTSPPRLHFCKYQQFSKILVSAIQRQRHQLQIVNLNFELISLSTQKAIIAMALEQAKTAERLLGCEKCKIPRRLSQFNVNSVI